MSVPVPKYASHTGGSRVGRGGLPRELVDLIHADYQRLKSCAKVAELHGRTRQAIHELLKTHGRQMQPLKRNPDTVWHDGEKFTPDHQGYLRCGNHSKYEGEVYLHRRIWVAANGVIPDEMEICMLDGNRRNVALRNLAIRPRGDTSRKAHAAFYLHKSRQRTEAVLKLTHRTNTTRRVIMPS